MWEPNQSKIGNAEVIGRRVLESDRRKDDPTKFKWKAFVEKRAQNNLSVDRLGENRFNPAVAKYLVPLGQKHAAALTPPEIFAGWATWKAAALRQDPHKLSLIPSRIEEDASKKIVANPFHADIETSQNSTYEKNLIGNFLASTGDPLLVADTSPAKEVRSLQKRNELAQRLAATAETSPPNGDLNKLGPDSPNVTSDATQQQAQPEIPPPFGATLEENAVNVASALDSKSVAKNGLWHTLCQVCMRLFGK